MITLKTLSEATAQEVFDQVATHLLTQKKQCAVGDGADKSCRYRNDEGLKCAAGCLIGDDEYCKEWDTRAAGWNNLVDEEIAPFRHEDLICKLQYLHDQFSPEKWKSALAAAASTFRLDASVLDKFE